MTKNFTVNNEQVEITEITAIVNGEEMDALLLHDLDDEFGDGDCILADLSEMPEDDETAENLVNNCYWETCFHVEDGKYICE